MNRILLGLTVVTALFSTLSRASESGMDEVAAQAMENFYSRFDTSPNKLKEQLPGQYDERCIGDREDPLDLGTLMPTGDRKGECMDLSGNRPVVILKGDENSDTITLGNIRYKGRYWIATVKKESVNDLQFNYVDFGKMKVAFLNILTAHTQVRFKFSEPMQLESQVISGTSPRETAELSDMIFTYNAYGVEGVAYDTQTGFKGNFGMVGKAIATADRAVEEILNDQSKVANYEFDFAYLSALNKKSVAANRYHYLITNFIRSQRLGYTATYNTLFRNCTTELFDALDEAFPELLAKSGNTQAIRFLYSFSGSADQHIKTLLARKAQLTKKGLVNSPHMSRVDAELAVYDETFTQDALWTFSYRLGMGVAWNIQDIVLLPSMSNLLERHLLPIPSTGEIENWRAANTVFLNDEPGFRSREEICAQTSICAPDEWNHRKVLRPHLLPPPAEKPKSSSFIGSGPAIMPSISK